MKVKYRGRSRDFEYGKEYNISFIVNAHGGSVYVEDYGTINYDGIADLALDWNVLGQEFISRKDYLEMVERMRMLP
ncbi:MAG: hypothetical protein IKW30_10970 [Lachnospiraceae bacterium]|nr:hypothetical protein [Lachnospiraceae bacterium]